jgi:methylase of polypeptide subunit release factors
MEAPVTSRRSLAEWVRKETGREPDRSSPVFRDLETLLKGHGRDPLAFRRLAKRRLSGEPMAYVLGYLEVMGQRFRVDRRAYITETEAEHLVGLVVKRARQQLTAGRRPLLAEFGTGCGSISILVKQQVPEAEIVGIDIDPGALAVAAQNIHEHGVAVELLESDMFSSWKREKAPDLIFADPPWGDETSDLWDERPLSHYQAMPPISVFPNGGRAGMHEKLIRDVRSRDWASTLLLNCGDLEPQFLDRLRGLCRKSKIHRCAKYTNVLEARAC